jgi:hypothetical protein
MDYSGLPLIGGTNSVPLLTHVRGVDVPAKGVLVSGREGKFPDLERAVDARILSLLPPAERAKELGIDPDRLPVFVLDR